MIKSVFIELFNNYGVDSNSSEELWLDLKMNYSQSGRYYHTLEHLEDLYIQLSEVKQEINNWNVILFTLFYHDVIYK